MKWIAAFFLSFFVFTVAFIAVTITLDMVCQHSGYYDEGLNESFGD